MTACSLDGAAASALREAPGAHGGRVVAVGPAQSRQGHGSKDGTTICRSAAGRRPRPLHRWPILGYAGDGTKAAPAAVLDGS